MSRKKRKYGYVIGRMMVPCEMADRKIVKVRFVPMVIRVKLDGTPWSLTHFPLRIVYKSRRVAEEVQRRIIEKGGYRGVTNWVSDKFRMEEYWEILQ